MRKTQDRGFAHNLENTLQLTRILVLIMKKMMLTLMVKKVLSKKAKIEILEESFELAGISTYKKHGKHNHILKNEVEIKVETTHNIMKKTVSVFLNESTERCFVLLKFQKIYYVKDIVLMVLWILLRQNCSFQTINNKFNKFNLTLAPQTEYKAEKARKLLQQKGLLTEFENNKGECISDNNVSLVQFFYQDDRLLLCLLGARDFVSMENK